jgi:hypothetical protein
MVLKRNKEKKEEKERLTYAVGGLEARSGRPVSPFPR